MAAAMWQQEKFSWLFSVAAIRGFLDVQKTSVKIGDRIDFFLVEDVGENLLVLTARDHRLDVMTTATTCDRVLSITSSVFAHT